jgi:DNA-3-methyladenine glycosylase
MRRSFFSRDPRKVARELIGCKIVKNGLEVEIVETEAYLGEEDPASHASNGETERNAPMYGEPGRAYVYICYGIHNMFNVVAADEGEPGAVLVRSARPIKRIDDMRENRGVEGKKKLCSGPGKLCEALNINKSDNEVDLLGGSFRVEEGEIPADIVKDARVGISEGVELEYRFFSKDSEFTST